MALTAAEWEDHRKHRAEVEASTGMWMGLFDEDCQPIFDCPAPESWSAPATRGAPTEATATFPVSDDLRLTHPLVDELISDTWGRVDPSGELTPYAGPTRYLVVETSGERRAYRVTHAKLLDGGADRPVSIEVHGEDLLSKLNRIPLFSAPTTISGTFTTFDRDWVGDPGQGKVFSTPRDLQGLKMVTVADGATLTGTAESVIRKAISRSIEAAFRAVGRPQTILVSSESSGVESPYLAFTMNDAYLWDGLGAVALDAGVNVEVGLWLPGDPQPPGFSGLTEPRMVVTVLQGQEVNNG